MYSELKKSIVVDESLSVFKPMFCYENTFNYYNCLWPLLLNWEICFVVNV